MKKLKVIKCYLIFETNLIFREKFEREKNNLGQTKKSNTCSHGIVMELIIFPLDRKKQLNAKTNSFEKKKKKSRFGFSQQKTLERQTEKSINVRGEKGGTCSSEILLLFPSDTHTKKKS